MKPPSLPASFGRRMLALLLLCIAAPGIFFGYLSLRRVEDKLRQDTLRGMRSSSSKIAITIYDTFSSASIQTEFLAGVLASPKSREILSARVLESIYTDRFVAGATHVIDGSRTEPLFGDPCPLPPLHHGSLVHLAAGKSLLYHLQDTEGGYRFFLAHGIPGLPPEREYLVCEINADPLWERVREVIPSDSEAAVLYREEEIYFRSGPHPSGLLERIGHQRKTEAAGSFEWGRGPEVLLVDYVPIFLKATFFDSGWTVVTTQPRAEAFAAAIRFRWILLLSITLIVLVAGLFAIVQVRRSVAPLATLREGTRRISGGDFDSRIEIGSGDEFEELARSFNAMAEQLGREFRSQAVFGRTIQLILGETDRGRIVRVLLDNVGSVVPCDYAGLSLLETPGQAGAMTTCTRDGSPADRSGTGRAMMFLDVNEAERLKSTETCAVATPGGEFGNFLTRGPVPRPATGIMAPILSHGELSGLLLIGYKNPFSPAREVLIRLRQIADQAAIALSRARLVEELNENDFGTLQALSRAVDTNSHWTAGHSQRVTALSMEIGWELGLPQREIDSLQRGGLLHDIGKLGIPTSILDKPAALTEEEFDLIKRHPSSGAAILRPIPTMEKIIPIVAQHHERYDGSGYPLGLKGDEISLHARIVALADVVDAVSSNRPYRPGWPQEKTLAFVRECQGAQFDPDVVKAFLRVAAQKNGGPLTGTAWSPTSERPRNPLPLDAAPAAGPATVREASFSGYSEPSLRD